MKKMHIKRGDNVKVISGKDKGNSKQTADLDLYALGTDNQYYMEWNSTKGEHAVSTYYDGK